MIILDACVAAKLFIAEADSDQAEALVKREATLVAPDLILVEVASALHKAWRREIIEAAHMDRALRHLPTLFKRLVSTSELVADAAMISRILRHPVQDCVYAALYWRTGAPVITADEAFVKATQAIPSWSDTAIRLRDYLKP